MQIFQANWAKTKENDLLKNLKGRGNLCSTYITTIRCYSREKMLKIKQNMEIILKQSLTNRRRKPLRQSKGRNMRSSFSRDNLHAISGSTYLLITNKASMITFSNLIPSFLRLTPFSKARTIVKHITIVITTLTKLSSTICNRKSYFIILHDPIVNWMTLLRISKRLKQNQVQDRERLVLKFSLNSNRLKLKLIEKLWQRLSIRKRDSQREIPLKVGTEHLRKYLFLTIWLTRQEMNTQIQA